MFSLKPLLFLLLTVACHEVCYGDNDVFAVSNGEHSSSMVLAENRTRRIDPSDGFEYYTGGWNLSDDHYISSVLYTGAPLFGIATIWFMGFGLTLCLICCYYCCCCCSCFRRPPFGYSRTAYACSLAFLTLFTIAAIVGCVVLYTGQGKLHTSTRNTLDFVVTQSKDTVNKLYNVLDILATSKTIGVEQVSLPPSMKSNIDRVDAMISKAATSLDYHTKKNEKDIKDTLNSVRLALIIVAGVMLLVALLGFLLSIYGLQPLVSILVVLGWILVTATFILCGIFLVLHNVMGDTCVAMDEWVQNPTAHTALDDILPCVDNATAQDTLYQTKDVTFQLVDTVNKIIINVANINATPYPSYISYNQSGPLVPVLCNPLNADRTDRKCQAGELDLGSAAEVWKKYVCEVNINDTCTTVGRLTPTMYYHMTAAANVSAGLTYYGPFLAGLMDCSFVRYTFTMVHRDHCPDMTEYSEWVYIGLAMVSVAVMLSLVLWVLYARERKHRMYTKLAFAASVPNSVTT